MPDSNANPAAQFIPLAGAYLCEDCHHFGNCAEQCAQCASANIAGAQGMLESRASIPLEDAFYCPDCNRIVANSVECTNCRSTALKSVQKQFRRFKSKKVSYQRHV